MTPFLELRAGIVEKHWSSNAAKQALLVVSQLTPYEAAHLFKELGAMQPSKSSLDRLPKKLSRQWEKRRDEIELSMREQFKIPKEAATLAASLDGVLVPMQDNVVIPGDSRHEEASILSEQFDAVQHIKIRSIGSYAPIEFQAHFFKKLWRSVTLGTFTYKVTMLC